MAKAYANVSICVRPPRGPRDPTHGSQHPANSAEPRKINVEKQSEFFGDFFFPVDWSRDGVGTDLIRRPNDSETDLCFHPPSLREPRSRPDRTEWPQAGN